MGLDHSEHSGALSDRAIKIAKIQRWQDIFFHRGTQFFALSVLFALLGIIGSLLINAWPALKEFGPGFFISQEWDVVNGEFGGLIAIYGTVVTSLIALVIAVPLSFGIAVFLTELCPGSLRRPLGTAVELLAAVPSIIYGMFGLFIFAPLFAEYVQPALANTLGKIPGFGILFSGAFNGIGILCAGLILAMMILPFITSVMRDVFEIVPPVLKELILSECNFTAFSHPLPDNLYRLDLSHNNISVIRNLPNNLKVLNCKLQELCYVVV